MNAQIPNTPEEILRLSSLREILGGFSHDMNQPLHASLMAAHILELKLDKLSILAEDRRFLAERVDIITNHIRKAANMVEGLRSFAKGESPPTDRAHLAALFARVYSLMARQFAARGITVKHRHIGSGSFTVDDPVFVETALTLSLAYSRDLLTKASKRLGENQPDDSNVLDVQTITENDRGVIELAWDIGEHEPAYYLDPLANDLHRALQLLEQRGGSFSISADGLSVTFAR